MEFHFFNKEEATAPTVGCAVVSSYSVFENELSSAFVIGGFELGSNAAEKLIIRELNFSTASWIPSIVCSNMVVNRCFHAAASTFQTYKRIYTFGGSSAPYSESTIIYNDIVAIQKNSFGIQAEIVGKSEKVAKLGLSAQSFGPSLDKIVIFGGVANAVDVTAGVPPNMFSNEVLLFDPVNIANQTVLIGVIESEGEKPPPRAHHASVIAGESNQLLIISGGETGRKELLADLWILDLQQIVEMAGKVNDIQEDTRGKKATAKGGKGKTAVSSGPVGRWTKIFDGSALLPARSMHCAMVSSAEMKTFNLILFGGLSLSGPSRFTDAVTVEIKSDEDGKISSKTHDFILLQDGSAESSEANNASDFAAVAINENAAAFYSVYGASAVPVFGGFTVAATTSEISEHSEEEVRKITVADAVGWIVVNGCRRPYDHSSSNKRFHEENISFLHIVDPESEQIKMMLKSVQHNNPSLFCDGDSSADDERDPTKPLRIDFPNGDVYEGQVINFMTFTPDLVDELTQPSVSLQQSSLDKNQAVGDAEIDNSRDNRGSSDKVPHGIGTMLFANGDKYEGHWSSGKFDGKGIFISYNGDVYEGDYVQHQRDGFGCYEIKSIGITYRGSFQRDEFHGQGELYDKSTGETYIGSFEYGERQGSGKIISADGSECTGSWSDGKLIGAGHTNNLRITSYNTALKKPLGECRSPTKNAQLHRDAMELDSPDGMGLSVSINNRTKTVDSKTKQAPLKLMLSGVYSGPLWAGQPSGSQGVCKYEDGSEYIGAWRAGKKNGSGTCLYPNMDEYFGKWVGDKRCGYGRLESVINSSYEGQWDDNLPHGVGKLFFKDGTCYSGDFVAGKRQGRGKIFHTDDLDKVMFDGAWEADRPV